MKLTILLFIVGLMQVSASVYSQATKFNFRAENKQIVEVLKEIEETSNFRFFYIREQVNVERKVSVKIKNATVEEILEELFKNEGINYRVMEDNLVLLSPENISSAEAKLLLQQQSISGKVTDEAGEPLPGVTVLIKGTTNGTVTNVDGAYTISNVPENATLQFSFIGMVTLEIVIGDQTSINVTLAADAIGIDEVVVVGYGVQKKANLTGSISQITADDIKNKPVSNVGQALQGVIPNLNVSVANGSPNTNPTFNVRGGTSFAKNSSGKLEFQTGSPLILVDGMEMDINQLNPDDIESVTVLKDAASAAIYGARAAYGVMLVTTKNGTKLEKTSVTYSNTFQWNRPATIPDLLDAYTIQDASIKALELENKSPSTDALLKRDKIKEHMDNPNSSNYYMDGNNIVWIGNTDVYEEAVLDNSPMQKHNLSISGGNGKTGYYGSIGYLSQDGLYKINTDNNTRYNVLLNVNSNVNKWLSMDLKTSYSYSEYNEPVSPSGKGGWWTAMSQEPSRNINMPIKTPTDSPVGEMYTDNILSFMDYGATNKQGKETSLISSSATLKPLKGWQIKGDVSYKSYDYNQKKVIPELLRIETKWDSPTNAHTSPTSITRQYVHTNQFTVNAYTDYNLKVKKHEAYALAGFNQDWYNYDYLYAKGEGILSPSIPFISQTQGNEYASDAASEWAIRGGFYRLTYNYDGKYLLESNGRYDGTSRFPKDSRFQFFSSFSGAWIVSSEPFAEFMNPVVDFMKLRASYGSLGNQNVSNYIYIPSYGTTAEVKHIFDGVRPMGVTPPGLVDPYLTWETATTIDFGIDMVVLKRLEVNFDWYKRTTTDILVAGDKFPAVVGTSAPTKNSGSLETKGWDFSAKWHDNTSSGLRYDVTFILSDYQTEITKFDGNPNKLLSSLYEGQKMGDIWGFETVGTFQSQEEIDAAPDQSDLYSGIWYPGDIQYGNLDEDDTKIGYGASTVDDPGDRKIIGNSTPRFQFGLNSNFAYKNFDLNIFLQGVAKRDVWISNKFHWGLIAGGTGTPEVYNNSWTPERTDAFFPAYKNRGSNKLTQTKYLQNAAYLRLKNITLGYTLPGSLTSRVKVSKLRVFASAYNMLSLTKLPDTFDPEMLSANYPMLKSTAVGVQITF